MDGMLTEIMSKIVLPALGSICLALTAKAIILINRKIDRQNFEQATKTVYIICIKVVDDLNQSMVEELKNKNADKKLTKEDAESVKIKAVMKVKANMQDSIIELFNSKGINFENYISTEIESIIFQKKICIEG